MKTTRPANTWNPHPEYFFEEHDALFELNDKANTEEMLVSMDRLGFELVDSRHPSPAQEDAEEDYEQPMSYYLWVHPAGILASAEIYHWEDGDKMNSMSWSYEQLPGCSRERAQAASDGRLSGGGSHGSTSLADGSLLLSSHVQSTRGNLFALASALGQGGPLVPLDQWTSLDLWFGAIPPQLPAQDSDLDYNAARKKLGGPSGIQLATAWCEGLPPELSILIKRSLGVEPPLSRDQAPHAFADRIRSCVDFDGRSDTSPNEKRLHCAWSSWLLEQNPSASTWLADPRAFEISDCGMSLLHGLIETAKYPHPEDIGPTGDPRRNLGSATLEFIEQAPLDQLMTLASTGDSRGVTPAARCFEILSSSQAQYSDGAMLVLVALLARLQENTPLCTAKATAMGAIVATPKWDFRDFHRYVAPTLDQAFEACQRAHVDWTQGGAVWSDTQKGKEVNEPDQAKAWNLAAQRFAKWGRGMDPIAERWALEAAASVKAPSVPAMRL